MPLKEHQLPKKGEARIVTVSVDDEGRVKQVWDEDREEDKRKARDANIGCAMPIELYGWVLDKVLNDAGPVAFDRLDPEELAVTASDPEETDHHNTIGVMPLEYLKLDCGYWGDQQGVRKRFFGLIQGADVWLCDFVKGQAAHENVPEPAAASPARRLLEYASKIGYTCKLISHAVAPHHPGLVAGQTPDLVVCFPDLHLPEKWPEYKPADRKPQGPIQTDHFQKLRQVLTDVQRKPGLANDNKVVLQQIHDFQTWLDSVEAGGDPPFNLAYRFKKHFYSPADRGSFSLTKDQVLAEKADLEREYRAQSTWFYRYRDELTAMDGVAFRDADPGVAVDLISLLVTIKLVKQQVQPKAVEVVQVGDLYELWMNREFLYLDFPSVDPPDNLTKKKMGDTAPLGAIQRKIAGGKFKQKHGLQYRYDKGWHNWVRNSVIEHRAKRFVHKEWPEDDMFDRRTTGWDWVNKDDELRQALSKNMQRRIQGKARNQEPDPYDANYEDDRLVSRLKQLAAERRQGVEELSFPLPNDAEESLLTERHEGLHSADKLVKQFWIERQLLYRANERDSLFGRKEYKYNNMILTMFQELRFKNIHGNHDGYRSDPLFAGEFAAGGKDMRAKEVLSWPGVWVEHGHRWDTFNRDGVTYGAGVTNLGYFYTPAIDELRTEFWSRKGQWYGAQEHKCFIAGSAQWFMLANSKDHRERMIIRGDNAPVEGFRIYVCGHTHNPDLIRVQIAGDKGKWKKTGRRSRDVQERTFQK